MNKWIGMGRLVADPDIKCSANDNNMAIAHFTVAIDRRYGGEEKQADFIRCVAFKKTAEFIENYIKKGTKVVVEGRIQTGSYEKDGVKHYTTDIMVEHIEFAESKAPQSNSAPAPTQPSVGDGFVSVADGIDEELPFA